MKIDTEYSIGDIVKIECIQEEFVPIYATHKTIELAVIDSIKIERQGITYGIHLFNNEMSYSRSKIIELERKADPKDLSFNHFFANNYYSNGTIVIDSRTGLEYNRCTFGDKDLMLYEIDSLKGIDVTEEEFEKYFKYKICFNREKHQDVSIKDSKRYLVYSDILNEEYSIETNNIERYCYLNDVVLKKELILNE